MQKSALAELGRISWASPQGNIAVKPAPIRLSALCTAFPRISGRLCGRSRRRTRGVLRRTSVRV